LPECPATMLREAPSQETAKPPPALRSSSTSLTRTSTRRCATSRCWTAWTPPNSVRAGPLNVELNLPPRRSLASRARTWSTTCSTCLAEIEKQAERVGARVLTIGILPTLTENHLIPSGSPRPPACHALNEQMLAARGEPFRLDIDGVQINGEPASGCRWISTRSPGGSLYVAAAAPAGPAGHLRGTLERRAVCVPACSWRWARTPHSCSAAASGRRPGCHCS